MKKIFLALAAVAALAACSKTEAEYEQTEEISFAPVAKNITKSMITGVNFPKTQSFNVWAWYKQVDANTSVADWAATDYEHMYINEGMFVNKGGTANWKGATSYYWPKLGSLLFAGYYPSSVKEQVDYFFNTSENKMVFSNIEQGVVQASGTTEDLMYFNMIKNSVQSGPVAVEFKHALSWITVNLSRTSDNAPGVDYPKIKVNSVTFTKVKPVGTGTVEGTDGVISWNTDAAVAINPVVTPENGVVLTKAVQKQTEPLFIPQVLIPDDKNTPENEAMQLVVNYTIFSSATEYFTETYSADLAGMEGKLKDSSTEKLSAWEPAKHYIYNITIGLDEILIAPTVADWEGVEVAVPIE